MIFAIRRRRMVATLFPYTTLFRSSLVSDSVWTHRRGVVFLPNTLRVPWSVPSSSLFWPALSPASISFILWRWPWVRGRSEEHTSELQSRGHLVCRLLLAKKQSATR